MGKIWVEADAERNRRAAEAFFRNSQHRGTSTTNSQSNTNSVNGTVEPSDSNDISYVGDGTYGFDSDEPAAAGPADVSNSEQQSSSESEDDDFDSDEDDNEGADDDAGFFLEEKEEAADVVDATLAASTALNITTVDVSNLSGCNLIRQKIFKKPRRLQTYGRVEAWLTHDVDYRRITQPDCKHGKVVFEA